MSLSPALLGLVCCFGASLFVGLCVRDAHALAAAQTRPVESAETVLDHRIHIEPGILELPQMPPLCDALKLDTRRIDVSACSLYCEIEGSGPALVLINGGPGGTHHGFHPAFGAAAAFARVIYYDQRGCGRSDYARAGGYTIDQAVEDLERLRAALNVDRWVVLGWSYGGFLAQCYTVKHPERVSGLVLVGSSNAMRLELRPTRQFDALSPEERTKVRELYALEGKFPNEQLLYNIHLNGDWKRQNFYRPTREELARMALYEWKHDPAFREDIGRNQASINLSGVFKGCPIPVLIVEGKYDLTWGEDKPGKLQACFPGSRLVLFERSAHAPFRDEPEKFFEVFRRFIGDLPEKPPPVAEWKRQVAARRAVQVEEWLRLLTGPAATRPATAPVR